MQLRAVHVSSGPFSINACSTSAPPLSDKEFMSRQFDSVSNGHASPRASSRSQHVSVGRDRDFRGVQHVVARVHEPQPSGDRAAARVLRAGCPRRPTPASPDVVDHGRGARRRQSAASVSPRGDHTDVLVPPPHEERARDSLAWCPRPRGYPSHSSVMGADRAGHDPRVLAASSRPPQPGHRHFRARTSPRGRVGWRSSGPWLIGS